MKISEISRRSGFASAVAVLAITMSAGAQAQVTYQQMADGMHAVMEADRTVYTRVIVNRLQNEEKVIKASEHWKDEKALVLPAQMFRYGAEMVTEKKMGFFYSLQSLWPVNKQNAPKTAVEKEGLEAVAKNPDKPFYKEETLGKIKYFTAIYADRAVAQACITCHNGHKDSPRTDFKMGEAMGGVVLRIPMK
ncbi:MAG: Tll0287-like domain-containing protein [Burkholderiales bacterium]